ncbi:MAG TPA: carboxypeptidase-like regulatory domain-containing protein, partial [Gemmatimonadaceae bacterium]
MITIKRISLVGAITAIGAGSLAAQAVSGSVVLRDSSAAISVIVQATDAQGKPAGRALTNSRGQFRLALPGDGRFDLRVLRIGYRPTDGPSVSVVGGKAAPVRIVLTSEAVVLTGINVRDRETCRISADSGMMVARLWEEAQKAMQTVQLSAEGEPLVAEWIEYDRTLDSTARIVRAQRVRTTREATTHAFRSRHSAEWLDSAGYVVTDGSGTTFFAPDADVLLSERFASAHCFHLREPPRESPTLIGVEFKPARDSRDKTDIEGTLWLDRRAAELQLLEFKYTNQPDAAQPAEPGGRVEFLRVAGGRWLVSRWKVRMPQLGARSNRTSDGLGKVVMSASNVIVRSVQVTGGEVTRVMQRDTVLYTARGPAVTVDVVARDSVLSVAAARLSLDGTDYTATADARGRIRISPVLDGRYRAELRAPLLDSLGVPPVSLEVEARLDGRVDTVALPRPRDVLLRVCPKDSVANGEGLLRGSVSTERGSVVPHAAVVVTWQTNFDIVGAVNRDVLRFTEKTLGALSDATGSWRICGVPVNTLLTVRALSDSGADLRRMRLGGLFGAVDLVARENVVAATANRELLVPTEQ